MPLDLFQPTELIGMIEPIRVPGNFLRALFFAGAAHAFDTPDIKWDRVFEDLRIAPWVSPYAPGKIQQDKGYQTESFVPGYLKPKKRIDPDTIKKRRPGEAIGGELSLADRRDAYFVDYLAGHKKQFERRDEVMASEILRTGGVVITGDDYPTAVVNFARTASLTKVLMLGARWGEAGVSPVSNLDAWLDEGSTTVGAAYSVAIFEKKAWALFSLDPSFKDKIDTTLGQGGYSSVNLGFTPGTPGSPVFKGRIGTVELYVYNDTYEDVDGSIKPLLPDYTVIVGAPGAYEGTPTYGAILDPRAGYQATPWFAKNWIEEDPAAEFLMSQSSPLMIPKRADASLCVTVR